MKQSSQKRSARRHPAPASAAELTCGGAPACFKTASSLLRQSRATLRRPAKHIHSEQRSSNPSGFSCCLARPPTLGMTICASAATRQTLQRRSASVGAPLQFARPCSQFCRPRSAAPAAADKRCACRATSAAVGDQLPSPARPPAARRTDGWCRSLTPLIASSSLPPHHCLLLIDSSSLLPPSSLLVSGMAARLWQQPSSMAGSSSSRSTASSPRSPPPNPSLSGQD